MNKWHATLACVYFVCISHYPNFYIQRGGSPMREKMIYS